MNPVSRSLSCSIEGRRNSKGTLKRDEREPERRPRGVVLRAGGGSRGSSRSSLLELCEAMAIADRSAAGIANWQDLLGWSCGWVGRVRDTGSDVQLPDVWAETWTDNVDAVSLIPCKLEPLLPVSV